MNRGELIDFALTKRSWKPSETGAQFRQEVAVQVQDALDYLHLHAPSALVPYEDRVVLLPEYASNSTVKLATTADPWVLKFTPSVSITPTRPYPVTDGTWDGIYHLEFKTSDGVTHRRQSREWWYATGDAPSFIKTYYVSLDRPFNQTATDMDFRIWAPETFLKDDVTKILDGHLFSGERNRVALASAFFNNTSMPVLSQEKGEPIGMMRGRHFKLIDPNYTPVATLDDEGEWLSPEPPGTFKYRYTYVWGKRDGEYPAPGNALDPQWESSPSPASNAVTVPSVGGASARISLPNIDFMQGFGDSGTLRYGRCGYRKRIYRARTTVGTGGTQPIEAPDIYHFIAEVDGLTTSWEDTGAISPDYFRRIPEVHGYFAYKFYPQQSTRYELDIRCVKRPERLLVDTDAPAVNPGAMQALKSLVVANLCLLDKQTEEYAFWKAQAEKDIGAFAEQQGRRVGGIKPAGYAPRRARTSLARLTGFQMDPY